MDLQTIIMQWQSAGVFDFVLPFLLIFAFVFGIMEKTKILGDKAKGINVLIAVAIGLISVTQFDTVPRFFQALFPNLGIGLAILFSVMILVYMFLDDDKKEGATFGWMIGLSVLGLIIAFVAVSDAFSTSGIGGGFGNFYVTDYIGWIVFAILIIGVIIAIASSGDKTPKAHKGG